MVDAIGKSYIVDYCRHKALMLREQRNYQIYITDGIAGLIRMWSKSKVPRYYDLMHPQPKDERTGQEIADDIIAKYGLKVVG